MPETLTGHPDAKRDLTADIAELRTLGEDRAPHDVVDVRRPRSPRARSQRFSENEPSVGPGVALNAPL